LRIILFVVFVHQPRFDHYLQSPVGKNEANCQNRNTSGEIEPDDSRSSQRSLGFVIERLARVFGVTTTFRQLFL
tara:strand:- start:248 stop:469 length:222 start_codon:yes stop_codon:yes gene_type:complete